MPDDLKPAENTKTCVYCGSSMSVGARLCPICGSYQSAWRSAVIYVAGITGLISLIASAFTFTISKIPDLRKMFNWTDHVTVWNFDTGLYPNFSITLSNTGDGPVIVSQIFVTLPDGYNVGYPIAETLQPGSETLRPRQSIAIAGGQVFPPFYKGYIYNHSGIANATVLKNAGSPWPEQKKLPCFGEILFSKDSLLLSRMREHGKATGSKLVEDSKAQAVVVYYSLHERKEVRYQFPVVTAFLQASDPSCDALDTQ
jgi:RNA polymerase subunit RPABC4/transcription elongation factor Spt4